MGRSLVNGGKEHDDEFMGKKINTSKATSHQSMVLVLRRHLYYFESKK